MSDRVLVTGAGGYLGRQVVDFLHNSGIETIAVMRQPLAGVTVGRTVLCDLTDSVAVANLIGEVAPSAVIHAAAWIGSGDVTPAAVEGALSSNVGATANLAAACAAGEVRRLVYCSTVEVYGAEPLNGAAHKEEDALRPQSLYGRTKAAGEFIVRSLEGSATQPIVLRMPGLHGAPRSNGIVHRLLDCSERGLPIELTEPQTRLSLLWVADAARVLGVAAIGKMSGAPTVLNVANGHTTLIELAQCVGQFGGKPLEIRTGSAASRNRVLDITRMHAGLPFKLAPFEDGLQLARASVPAA